MRRVHGHLPELDEKALAQIGGKNACGFEVLKSVQNSHDFVELKLVACKAEMNLLRCLCQSTVNVDGVDESERDGVIRGGKAGKVELPQEVLLQCFRQ